jgi:UDP-GlcNAc:undecaprenyl-phosphate GlcNAc-1-phosphate transferase
MLGLNRRRPAFRGRAAGVKRPPDAALLGGAVLAVGIGLLDDKYQLRARWQFLGQFAWPGWPWRWAWWPRASTTRSRRGTLAVSPAPIAAVATLIWIVGMINSINFIDGLDGLSSGIALIAARDAGHHQPGVGTPSRAVRGPVLLHSRGRAGGLPALELPSGVDLQRDERHHAGRLLLAVLSILGAGKIAVALLVLGVPIMDTFWIIVRRTAAGRSPFAPDRGHIHHRLLDLGLSHRNTVLVIYGVCIVLAILSLVLSGTGQMYAFLGLVVVFGLALFLIERLGGRSGAIEESLDADSYAGHEERRRNARDGNPGEGRPPAGEELA